ncbi:hypothetical protein BDV96DRAFT_593816 [Lophiotrema nucula]|uniref:Uncharacterized protein n=1 Tax=Lophiotrema nucula TaxID=690887 RepID=A0A6A5ZRX2_9PLEO|nr:hypothetical protein BDV96DRAFT_593816 [Lophiotrema nucula]
MSEQQETTQKPTRIDHSIGHCRAQRFALTSQWNEQYEKEKASIKAYEDGWDRWDGPIWPWRHTNHLQHSDESFEEHWVGCCDSPLADDEVVAKIVTAKSNELPVQYSPPRPASTLSASTISTVNSSVNSPLWNSCCPKCGRSGSSSHL